MCIFHFQLIDLDLWNAFCEVSPWGSFLFTLQRQKKVCNPGDEAMMKIHKKLFIGIPLNVTFSFISPKLQGVWRRNFRFAIRKIRAFIYDQKIHNFRLSPGGWEWFNTMESLSWVYPIQIWFGRSPWFTSSAPTPTGKGAFACIKVV